MLPENFKAIKGHIRKMNAANMRETTVVNHIKSLIQFGTWCPVLFSSLDEEAMLDYRDFIDRVTFESKGEQKKYKESSKYMKLATVKAFLQKINKSAANALTMKPAHNRKLPEDLLTREEVEALINACQNARDRAMISCFYESGARKGELLGTLIKHIQFDDNGSVVTFPDGKTGARRVRLVFSSSYLREWLEVHPNKHDRESPVFCSFRTPFNVISTTGLTEQLDRIAHKAGITKKIHPHAFRHARATHLAEHLTEQQLKKYLGWTEGSRMAAVYVHLSGKDLDDAILKLNGIQIDDTHTDGLKVGRCPRCHEINPENAKFCYKCGLPLTQEAVTTVESIKTDYMQLSDLEEIREMKNALKQELEEISKLKEMILKNGK
jgi:integrase